MFEAQGLVSEGIDAFAVFSSTCSNIYTRIASVQAVPQRL